MSSKNAATSTHMNGNGADMHSTIGYTAASASPSGPSAEHTSAGGSHNAHVNSSNAQDTDASNVNITSPASAADKITDAVSSLTSSEGDDAGKGSAHEPKYTLTIDEGVVEKISSLAAQKVDGIVDMKGSVFSMIQEGLGGNDDKKGVDADVDDGTATVELSIILEYGKSAIEVFNNIKDTVAGQVKDMTGLEVTELTVNVVDVADAAEWNAEHASRKDDSEEQRRAHVTLAKD